MHYRLRLIATCRCHWCTQFPSVTMMHGKFSFNTVQLSSPNYASNSFSPIASASTLWGMTWQQAKSQDTFILQRCWTQYACALSSILLFPVFGQRMAERPRFHGFERHLRCLSSAQEKVAITPIHILTLLLLLGWTKCKQSVLQSSASLSILLSILVRK